MLPFTSFGYNAALKSRDRLRPIPVQMVLVQMIEIQSSKESPNATIVEARTNLSLTLDRLAAIFLVFSAFTLLVALWPTLMGLWPVMVIAIIHLLIVGWCLRLAWRGNWALERIAIDQDWVTIEHHAMRTHRKTRWPAAWARVELGRKGQQVKVLVGCHGKQQEVGAFLPESERLELARAIETGLGPYTAWSEDPIGKVS